MTTSASSEVTSFLTGFSEEAPRLSLVVTGLLSEVLALEVIGSLGLDDDGRGLLARDLGLEADNLELRPPGVEDRSS
jgi:hypothetical protein